MKARRLLALSVCAVLTASMPTFAQSISVQDIQDLPTANSVNSSKAFNNDHWAYKTLKNVSKKYGLVIGNPGEKFDGNKPITRNEAAVMLVNLVGKIEQDNLKLNEVDKAKLEILRSELRSETQRLVGKIAEIETSVDTLNGRVSTVEAVQERTLKLNYGKDLRFIAGGQFQYSGIMQDGTTSENSNFKMPIAFLGIKGKVTDDLEVMIGSNLARNSSTSTSLLTDAYVASTHIPNHKIYVGQVRIPIGVSGTTSPFSLDFIERSMIGSKFSNKRDVGIKVAGKYKYMDYYLGAFNGNRYMTSDNNTEMDLSSWVSFKPLAGLSNAGHMEIGTGYTLGKGDASYDILGAYLGYKYKKFGFKSEYALADGYNGTLALHDTDAEGYYLTTTYDLNKDWQLLARFDNFNENSKISGLNTAEYTFGVNRYMFDKHLKLQLNYVYQDEPGKDDNGQRVMFFTQYLL